MDFGAVPHCGVVFIESGRDCVRREGGSDREAGTWKAYKKEGGDGAMSLYTRRRRRLRLSLSLFI